MPGLPWLFSCLIFVGDWLIREKLSFIVVCFFLFPSPLALFTYHPHILKFSLPCYSFSQLAKIVCVPSPVKLGVCPWLTRTILHSICYVTHTLSDQSVNISVIIIMRHLINWITRGPKLMTYTRLMNAPEYSTTCNSKQLRCTYTYTYRHTPCL